MEHMYYPKISNGISLHTSMSSKWVATEKIHGAQFVIGVNEKEVKFGKRKAWLDDNDPFFGWQIIRNKLEESVKQIFSKLKSTNSIYLYGELFGGSYPHDKVKNCDLLTPVQTGIWYSPDLQFAVFDILEEKMNGEELFMKFSDIEKIVDGTQLVSVPVLKYGTYSELQKLPVKYKSLVYKEFNLPEIEMNFAEGFVLKPDIQEMAVKRPIVKYKIPEFSENRFDESRPFDPDKIPDVDELLGIIPMMINKIRIDSARSKVGEDIELVIEESVLDVMIDLESVFPLKISILTEEEERIISETIKRKIKELI